MLHPEAYLFLLKKKLLKVARERYNYECCSLKEYKYFVHRIQKAPTVGDVFRVVKDMELGAASALRIAISSFVDIDEDDFVEAPETW